MPEVKWDQTSKVQTIEHSYTNVIFKANIYKIALWQRVLTTEFIEGIKISDAAALQKAGISIAEVSHKLVEAFAEQIFHTGFVHADPHPGNSILKY